MKKKQNVNCKNPSRNYLGLLINQFSVHLFATYANSRRIFIFFFVFCALKMPLQQIMREKERNGLHRYNSDAQVWNFQNRFGQFEYALRLSKFVCEVGFPRIYGNLNFHHKQCSKCFVCIYPEEYRGSNVSLTAGACMGYCSRPFQFIHSVVNLLTVISHFRNEKGMNSLSLQ